MAKDQEYEEAVEKGTRLLQMLTEKSKTFAESAFRKSEELTQHGYHLEPKQTNFEIECVAKALRDLDVNDKMIYNGGENVRIYHVHGVGALEWEGHTTVHGYFSQVSNPHAGVLIADDNLTPLHAVTFNDTEEEEEEEEEDDDSGLPLLRHWSDVAFLQYLSSFPSPPVQLIPLNYVFRVQIQNVETFLVLNKIIKMHSHGTYDLWPGVTFDMESQEGKAILGTPNGSGVAWMLIQHSKVLGERTVKKVTVFHAPKKGDLFRWPSLLFWIL